VVPHVKFRKCGRYLVQQMIVGVKCEFENNYKIISQATWWKDIIRVLKCSVDRDFIKVGNFVWRRKWQGLIRHEVFFFSLAE